VNSQLANLTSGSRSSAENARKRNEKKISGCSSTSALQMA